MTKNEFKNSVIMAVEIEYDMGGRNWTTMKADEVDDFIKKTKENGDYFSDLDYAGEQTPEIRAILDEAWEVFIHNTAKFKNYDAAIDSLLEDDEPTEPAEPAKKVWTEDEIKSLVQTNDKVLYGALKKLYAQQTADEQRSEVTREKNGRGFNSIDAKFLTSVAEFLNKTGFLTDKQKVIVRRKLVKYNKQLTRLANA